MVQHDNLLNHFKTNIGLQKHHNFSLDTLENMLPWERLVYVDIIKAQMDEEKRNAIDAANAMKDQQSLIRKINKKR